MDVQDKKLLEVTSRLARENNTILKKMRRAMLWGRAFKIVYWVVAIALAFGAYYLIQPYLEQLVATYSGLKSGIQNIQDVGSRIPDLRGFLGGDGQ